MAKNKKKFEAAEGETLDAVLDRIKAAGYMPVRRTEQPVFEERVINGNKEYVPISRKIVFEAIQIDENTNDK